MIFHRNLHGIHPKKVDYTTRNIQSTETKTNWTNREYTPKQQRTFVLMTTTFASKGVHQFKDLRTVDGQLCPTFKAACVAMNLIENDDMWINCMDEAMNLYTATSCTNLLIAILCENEVANP